MILPSLTHQLPKHIVAYVYEKVKRGFCPFEKISIYGFYIHIQAKSKMYSTKNPQVKNLSKKIMKFLTERSC